MDQDSTKGFVYIAGITTATDLIETGAKQSVFVAKYNGYKLEWMKVIGGARVDTVEYLSAMGDFSDNLFLYTTSS